MSGAEVPEIRSVVSDDIEVKIGNYVIICYNSNVCPGVIISFRDNEVCVSAMEKCGREVA